MFTYEQGNLVQGLPPQQPVARLASTVSPHVKKNWAFIAKLMQKWPLPPLCGEFGVRVITDNNFAVVAAQNTWWLIVADGYFSTVAPPINCGCAMSHWAWLGLKPGCC